MSIILILTDLIFLDKVFHTVGTITENSLIIILLSLVRLLVSRYYLFNIIILLKNII